MPWMPGDHASRSHVTFSFYRMKIYFYRMKIFLPNENIPLNGNIFYRMKTLYQIISSENYFYWMKIFFVSNKNIFYRMEIYILSNKNILSNENIFLSHKIIFIECKYIFIEFCYISATIHEFVKKKKQNGGWNLSDTDWLYFSFYNPSCFFLWSDSNFILFLFFHSIRVGPSRSGPTFVPASCEWVFLLKNFGHCFFNCSSRSPNWKLN